MSLMQFDLPGGRREYRTGTARALPLYGGIGDEGINEGTDVGGKGDGGRGSLVD
jgi:hypothetical protein